MAGMMQGATAYLDPLPSSPNERMKAFSPKNTRAYAEGRQDAFELGDIGNNPHVAGSEAANCWARGFTTANSANRQWDTAYVGTI